MISVAAEPAPQHRPSVGFSGERIRLLVVDDHAAVRAGLRELLEYESEFDVMAAVGSAEAALTVAEREPLDVAVVAYQLGGRTGLWVSRKLKRLARPPAVVIHSAYTDGVLAAAAVVAEADGVVSNTAPGSELRAAIRGAAREERLLPPIPPWLGETLRRRLDPEEQAIFGMLLAGVGTRDIARALDLSATGLDSRLRAMLHTIEVSDPKALTTSPGRPDAL
jgi:DNA-binding NarL/FixJ family response regulator